ncbi:MAG: hypothetical protein NTY77_14985 [Elusimicrobia bacterium]|nr:hypothetical protein [Elusimicrobiota bacterium]
MTPDQPAPPAKLAIRRTLRLGSGLLAAAAILDLAREAYSGGSWLATPGLGQAYAMVLTAYAATREWEKWTDPKDQTAYHGHYYLLAWITLPLILWLTDITNIAAPAWPANLNTTLGCVLAAYAGSKASSRWRGFTRRAFVKARLQPPAQPEPLTPDRLLTRHTLRIGAMLLGAACLWDAAVEAFSAGAWTYTGHLVSTYSLVLGAYAATREWEKWTDPYDQDAYWGQWFVAAWCLLPVLIWLTMAVGFPNKWPSGLTPALAAVLGVFAGSKASAAWRADKAKKGWGNVPGLPQPAPGDGAALPADPPGPADQVARACRKRGAFTAEQIASDTGLTLRAARGHLGVLVREGYVSNDGNDQLHWIGP